VVNQYGAALLLPFLVGVCCGSGYGSCFDVGGEFCSIQKASLFFDMN
jgi:hypothetical protein